MSPHTPFDAVRDGAVLLGGVVLFIAPFTARGRVAPHWMRVALWLSCPIAVAWSFLGFTLAFGSLRLSQHTYYAIGHTKAVWACPDSVDTCVMLLAPSARSAARKQRG